MVDAHSWVTKYAFLFSVGIAAISMLICLYRKGVEGLTFQAPFLDALRAAAAFPLILFAMSPMYPDYGSAALTEDSLIVALGALGGVAALASDWWRNI